MANFNTNSWYQLFVTSSETEQAMDGSVLYDQGHGSVFFQNTNTSHIEQLWQLFPFNSTTYVLRTRGSGPTGYLNVAVAVNESTAGNTVPVMLNYTLSDQSMFWQISPWGDGTFYLTNAANGTQWHLEVKSNSLMAMSSNITAPQDGQSFSFKSVGTIDDTRFSSVSTVATPTATPTGITTSTASPPPNSSSSKGLSTGAKAGIGVGVAVAAIIFLFFVGCILLRRRKRRSAPQHTELPTSEPTKEPLPTYSDTTEPAELHTRQPSGQGIHELQPTQQYHELDGGSQSAELQSNIPADRK